MLFRGNYRILRCAHSTDKEERGGEVWNPLLSRKRTLRDLFETGASVKGVVFILNKGTILTRDTVQIQTQSAYERNECFGEVSKNLTSIRGKSRHRIGKWFLFYCTLPARYATLDAQLSLCSRSRSSRHSISGSSPPRMPLPTASFPALGKLSGNWKLTKSTCCRLTKATF